MKVELMRYRKDSLSFFMNIWGLIFDAVYLIAIYKDPLIRANVIGVALGIDIIYNILFLLIAFLVAEKVKAYTLNWCWVSLVMGVIQFIRIAFLPRICIVNGQLVGFNKWFTIICLILSGGFMIAGCVTSFIKSRKLNAYLEEIKAKGE